MGKFLFLLFILTGFSTASFANEDEQKSNIQVTVEEIESEQDVSLAASRKAREGLEADESRLPGLKGKIDALSKKLNFKKQFLSRYRMAKQEGGDPAAMDGIKNLIFLSSFSHGSEVIGGFYTMIRALLMDASWEYRTAMFSGGAAVLFPGGVDFVCYIVIVPYLLPNKIAIDRKIFGYHLKKELDLKLPGYYRSGVNRARLITIKGIATTSEYTGLKQLLESRYEQRNVMEIIESRIDSYNSKNKNFIVEQDGENRFGIRPSAKGIMFRTSSGENPYFDLRFETNESGKLNLQKLVIRNDVLEMASLSEMRASFTPFGMNVKDAVMEVVESLKDRSLEWESKRFFVEDLYQDKNIVSVTFKSGALELFTRYQKRKSCQILQSTGS